MPKENLFLDTSFIIALLSTKDSLNVKARSLMPRLNKARVWITEAVLTEVGNDFSNRGNRAREEAIRFIENCYRSSNFVILSVERSLFVRAIELYKKRPDKTYGLVDCISFVVMRDNNLTLALTFDQDFVQEGFVALMRD